MNEDKAAITQFFGTMYGQMKEIDNHIAAAGGNAKFAGRSEDIKNAFVTIASPSFVPVPVVDVVEVQPGQLVSAPPSIPQTPISQPAPVKQDTGQLEFEFKSDEKSILKDIYNVLYDIKRLLSDRIRKEDAEAKEKKVKEYTPCCICGSQPAIKVNKTAVGRDFHMTCTGCQASEVAASKKDVISAWNKENRQL